MLSVYFGKREAIRIERETILFFFLFRKNNNKTAELYISAKINT